MPGLADAYNYLGYMYAEKGVNLDEAIELIGEALKIEPDNGAYIDSLGWAYFQKGMVDEALAELEKAAGLMGDDPTIREHLGDAYRRKGMLGRAAEEWRKALELDPDNEEIREKLSAAGEDGAGSR